MSNKVVCDSCGLSTNDTWGDRWLEFRFLGDKEEDATIIVKDFCSKECALAFLSDSPKAPCKGAKKPTPIRPDVPVEPAVAQPPQHYIVHSYPPGSTWNPHWPSPWGNTCEAKS